MYIFDIDLCSIKISRLNRLKCLFAVEQRRSKHVSASHPNFPSCIVESRKTIFICDSYIVIYGI